MAVAVIIRIIHNDEILFSKYAHTPYKKYALIAGFAEVGESLEDTIKRGVFEEVGLNVKNIKYYDNQPWGFSQSLLIGFFCEVDGEPTIHIDNNELSEAVWMKRKDIPIQDTHVSLTSKMMEAFRIEKV